MEYLDLKDLLNFFKKKIHIIILFIILAMSLGSAYIFLVQKPDYKAKASVVLSSNQTQTITQAEVLINKNLVDTYTEIVKSRRVLDNVISKLNLDQSYEELSNKISVSAPKNVEIIEVYASNSNPELAQKTANATADIFVKEIHSLYNIKNVNILDYAVVPSEPYNIEIIKQELIALLAGIILGSTVIFLIYYFDRTIKTQEQIEKNIKLPFIGKIRDYKGDSTDTELVLKADPKSRISEDFRTIRTNLHFFLNGKDNKTILFTSSIPGEGKSFTVSNLAIAFAKTGKKVIVVDSDMRLGRIHEIFNVSNNQGLSNLLADHKSTKYTDYICSTKITNLSVMPRGTVPPNPSELLDSADMDRLLSKLRVRYDYVILDGTPVDDLSDSLIASKKVDRVTIICSSGKTNIEDLNNTKKSLQNVQANIAGIIINKVPEQKRKNKYNKYYL